MTGVEKYGWIEDGHSITKQEYIEMQVSTKDHVIARLQLMSVWNFLSFFESLLEDHDGAMCDNEEGSCRLCEIQHQVISFDVDWYAYCECGHRGHFGINLKCNEENCKCEKMKIVEYRRAFLREAPPVEEPMEDY